PTGEGDIILVDGAPVLLTPMSEKAQKYTYDTLTKMGVKVQLNVQVKNYEDDVVYFSDGTTIKTKVLIWAAGVTSTVFNGIPAESIGRGRRMLVDATNLVKGTSNIYAIGDTCYMDEDPA